MKRTVIQLSALFLLLSVAGCKKLADFNVDPNNPSLSNASPQLLFPSAVMASAGEIGGEYAITGGIWAQYYTQSATASQYRTIDAYNIIPTDNNIAYRELYRSALSDYKKVQDLSSETNQWGFYLMATVMKGYTFHVLADIYDKIPYTEALQGSANLQPKFDDGYTVYQGIIAEINDALSKDFGSALSASDARADIVFNGDLVKWQQFANTLKLKLFLRMVNARADEAEQGVKALYDQGAEFLSSGAGVTGFVDKPNYSNPFYEQNIRRLNTNDNLRASETFVSFLNDHNDPRVVEYFGTTAPGAINQGDFTSTNPAYPGAAVFVQHPTDPVWFISEAESYFLQAEARERYYGGDNAKTLYEQGVTAAFAQVGLTPGGLLNGDYKYPETGSLEEKIEAIVVQKWASFPGTHDLEAFFEKNRTGYPKTSPVYSTDPAYVPGQFVYSKNGVTGGAFPQRLLFPDIERARNINTPPEVPITTKVWWAK